MSQQNNNIISFCMLYILHTFDFRLHNHSQFLRLSLSLSLCRHYGLVMSACSLLLHTFDFHLGTDDLSSKLAMAVSLGHDIVMLLP